MHRCRHPSTVLRSTLLHVYTVGLLPVFLTLIVVQPCHGATVTPHPDCGGLCGESNLQCRSSHNCKTAWDSCPPGTMQDGNATQAVDLTDMDHNCHWTDCTPGGCEQGFQETESKICFDFKSFPQGVYHTEHCCPLRTSVKCCPLLPCNVTYQDCLVPSQTYLVNTSRSSVDNTTLKHGGVAVFPFFTAPTVPYSSSCERVRVWGSCRCEDGRGIPGCEPTNSSTWFRGEEGPLTNTSAAAAAAATTATPLPANLSLTCVVLPQEPTAAAASPPAVAADVATQGSVQSPPPPPRPPDGGGGGGVRSHGSFVALIVIGCLLLAGCTVGIVLYCCGLLPDLHNLRIRNLTAYEPIFTGQSYTPDMGGRRNHARPPSSSTAPANDDDIPWNRFCAAVVEAGRRLLYGRRYIEESAGAAAAAQRYRTLNALGRFRSGSAAGGTAAVGGGGGDETERRAWLQGKKLPSSSHGSVLLASYPPSRNKAQSDDVGDEGDDDDLGVDDVFTLDDLGTAGSDSVGMAAGPWRRHTGQQLPLSRPATTAATPLPLPLRASSGASASAASTAPSPAGPRAWGGRAGMGTSGGPAGSLPAVAAVVTSAATGFGSELAASRGSPFAASMTTTSTTTIAHIGLALPPAPTFRSRLNQFGLSTAPHYGTPDDTGKDHGRSRYSGAGGNVDGGGDHEVIHTRPLPLVDGGGGGGEGDDAVEVSPDDVDAPLRWLPSPQVTGT